MSSGTLAPTTLALCQLLDREAAACRSLLETVQEERTAIHTLAITEFHSINCKRLVILESLQMLEHERLGLVQSIAQRHGLAQTTTIQTLIDRLGAASADLRARYDSFIEIAKMVRAEIAHNVVLIEGIRGVLDKALTAGSKIVPGLDVYNSDGQRSDAASVNVLIHQRG